MVLEEQKAEQPFKYKDSGEDRSSACESLGFAWATGRQVPLGQDNVENDGDVRGRFRVDYSKYHGNPLLESHMLSSERPMDAIYKVHSYKNLNISDHQNPCVASLSVRMNGTMWKGAINYVWQEQRCHAVYSFALAPCGWNQYPEFCNITSGKDTFKTVSSLVASIMLPFVFSFPVINAFWPLIYPNQVLAGKQRTARVVYLPVG